MSSRAADQPLVAVSPNLEHKSSQFKLPGRGMTQSSAIAVVESRLPKRVVFNCLFPLSTSKFDKKTGGVGRQCVQKSSFHLSKRLLFRHWERQITHLVHTVKKWEEVSGFLPSCPKKSSTPSKTYHTFHHGAGSWGWSCKEQLVQVTIQCGFVAFTIKSKEPRVLPESDMALRCTHGNLTNETGVTDVLISFSLTKLLMKFPRLENCSWSTGPASLKFQQDPKLCSRLVASVESWERLSPFASTKKKIKKSKLLNESTKIYKNSPGSLDQGLPRNSSAWQKRALPLPVFHVFVIRVHRPITGKLRRHQSCAQFQQFQQFQRVGSLGHFPNISTGHQRVSKNLGYRKIANDEGILFLDKLIGLHSSCSCQWWTGLPQDV